MGNLFENKVVAITGAAGGIGTGPVAAGVERLQAQAVVEIGRAHV